MNAPSFTDIPRNTAPQKTSPVDSRQKIRFRKTALVTTAVQSKKTSKTNNLMSDNSDSDDSIQSMKKVKKKSKSTKGKLMKGMSENKSKN